MVAAALSEWNLASPLHTTGVVAFRLAPRDLPAPVLSQPKPKWIDATVASLETLARLGPDWDSYGARPVELFTLQQVYGLLQSIMDDDTPAPALVPMSDGSIQMEWHTLGLDLEIRLLSGADLEVYFEDLDGTEEPVETVLSYDVTRLTELMQLLAVRARLSNMRDVVRD